MDASWSKDFSFMGLQTCFGRHFAQMLVAWTVIWKAVWGSYVVVMCCVPFRPRADAFSERVCCRLLHERHIGSCVKASRFLFSPSSPAQWRWIEGARRGREGLGKKKGGKVHSLPRRFPARVDHVPTLMHACHPLWHHPRWCEDGGQRSCSVAAGAEITEALNTLVHTWDSLYRKQQLADLSTAPGLLPSPLVQFPPHLFYVK